MERGLDIMSGLDSEKPQLLKTQTFLALRYRNV
jgi:hypothetical protein